MITLRHRVKLIAFVVIAVVSVAYVAANYAGMGKLIGAGGYTVTARFDTPGGIFVGAEVTYRGVAVGSVSDMRLTEHGLAVDLEINPEAPPIPADTAAAVHNRSPIGEQYVDLQPPDGEGTELSGGDVIPDSRTTVPAPISNVLLNLNQLVNSINKEALRTVVDEAHQAFAGAGDDLQVLLDTASSFSETALRKAPVTEALLSDARTVLRTQLENSENITTLAAGFADIAEQLKASDPDLRTIINETPALSEEVRSFLAESGSDLSVLFANLLTTARIAKKRTDSIEMLLVALPVISAQGTTRAPNGFPRLSVVMNYFNPPSCTKGYDTKQRPPTDTSPGKVNFDAYCAEPPGSQTGVRGAQNAPYAGKPVTVPAPPPASDGYEGGQQSSGSPSGAQRAQADNDGLPGVLDLSEPGVQQNSVGALLGAGG